MSTLGSASQTTSTHPFHQCGMNGSDPTLASPPTFPRITWDYTPHNQLFIHSLFFKHNFIPFAGAFFLSCWPRERDPALPSRNRLRNGCKITFQFTRTEGLPSSSILGGPSQRRSACVF